MRFSASCLIAGLAATAMAATSEHTSASSQVSVASSVHKTGSSTVPSTTPSGTPSGTNSKESTASAASTTKKESSSAAATAAKQSATVGSAQDLIDEAVKSQKADKLKGKKLRVMPLGASITEGVGSSQKNGYRKGLFDLLSKYADDVNFIGSQKIGTMENNDNEGHSGWVIKDVGIAAGNSLPKNPNVVLVFAGTNDMNQHKMDGAPERMGDLVDKVHKACSDATILVAQITTVGNNDTQATNTHNFNKGLPEVIKKRTDAGVHVKLVDMEHALAMPAEFSSDKVHPNDDGYKKIAASWFNGIAEAASEGWIKDPKGSSDSSSSASGSSSATSSGASKTSSGASTSQATTLSTKTSAAASSTKPTTVTSVKPSQTTTVKSAA